MLLRDGRKLMGLLRSFDQFGTFCVSFSISFALKISKMFEVFCLFWFS